MVDPGRVNQPLVEHHGSTSAAWTVMVCSRGPPNVVAIATSEASRPRPITTRPLRRAPLRGSKVHQRSSSHTSIQAAKSIGAGSIGTSMSGRYPNTYRAGMFKDRKSVVEGKRGGGGGRRDYSSERLT